MQNDPVTVGKFADRVGDAAPQLIVLHDVFDGRESGPGRLDTALEAVELRQVLVDRLLSQPVELTEHLPEFDRFDCRIEAPWSGLAPVEDVMQNDELRRRVADAIDELPDGYRVVLHLRDIEGYDTAEVAAHLDISVSNVKVRLHRARSALKKLLEPVLRGEVE